MNPLGTRSLSLSLEQIDECAEGFKEDLQREANRAARRHDANAACAALEGMDYIDKFVYTLKLRAGSRLGMPARSRPIRIVPRKGGRG